jgi:phage terminase large subunit
MPTITLKGTRSLEKHYKAAQQERVIVSEGGARSGKTYSILMLLIIEALQRKTLSSVVAENIPFLKRGAIRDFTDIMMMFVIWKPERWSRVDKVYTFANGSVIEFFSADSPGKAIGSKRDNLFLNECDAIPYEIAFQLMGRTTGKIYIDYNPRSEFWAHTEIMPTQPHAFVHTTYRDNHYLQQPIIDMMLRRAAIDDNYRRVYVDGLVGSLEGLVFPTFELVDEAPHPVCYGLDWGYTNDPTAVVGLSFQGDTLYLSEVIYSTGLRNVDIDRELRNAAISKTVPIYCDSAEPKSIDDLYILGWNVHPATKGRQSIMYGIDLIKGYKLAVTKDSTNIIKELRNYTWLKDKMGNWVNEPIDGFNHAIDAARYGLMGYTEKQKGYKYVPRERNTFEL